MESDVTVMLSPPFPDTLALSNEEAEVPKSKPPYPAGLRQQIIELARAGRACSVRLRQTANAVMTEAIQQVHRNSDET